MYINDSGIYITGWYSVSPAFAWWNFDAHRVAAIKARREAARVAEENKRQKKIAKSIVNAIKKFDQKTYPETK